MSEELLPCPFCGGEGFIYNVVPNYAWWACKCASCGVETSSYHTEAEAIEAWNRRVVTDTNVGDKERISMVWKPAKGRPAYEKGICNCGYVLSVLQRDFVYCPKCGAKLEWSD